MDKINDSIIELMYENRKEDFEQSTYNNDDEIKKIEKSVCKKNEEILDFVKKHILNEEDYQKFSDMFTDYDLEFSKEIYFWSKEYYKLGMKDLSKLKYEIADINDNSKKYEETFLDYAEGDLDEYLYNNYYSRSREYKRLRKLSGNIVDKYPNIAKLYENFEEVELNKEETKAFIEYLKIEFDIRSLEFKIAFKAGLKETSIK